LDMQRIGNLVSQMIDSVVAGTMNSSYGFKDGDLGDEVAPDLAFILTGRPAHDR